MAPVQGTQINDVYINYNKKTADNGVNYIFDAVDGTFGDKIFNPKEIALIKSCKQFLPVEKQQEIDKVLASAEKVGTGRRIGAAGITALKVLCCGLSAASGMSCTNISNNEVGIKTHGWLAGINTKKIEPGGGTHIYLPIFWGFKTVYIGNNVYSANAKDAAKGQVQSGAIECTMANGGYLKVDTDANWSVLGRADVLIPAWIKNNGDMEAFATQFVSKFRERVRAVSPQFNDIDVKENRLVVQKGSLWVTADESMPEEVKVAVRAQDKFRELIMQETNRDLKSDVASAADTLTFVVIRNCELKPEVNDLRLKQNMKTQELKAIQADKAARLAQTEADRDVFASQESTFVAKKKMNDAKAKADLAEQVGYTPAYLRNFELQNQKVLYEGGKVGNFNIYQMEGSNKPVITKSLDDK